MNKFLGFGLVMTLIISVSSCAPEIVNNGEKLSFEPTELRLVTNSWDPVPFYHSDYIKNKMIPEKGNQYGAWAYSYIGKIKEANATWAYDRENPKAITAEEKEIFLNAKAVNAKSHILDQSKNQDIIIINEAHHSPENRVFTESLLQGLYDNGYRYLGLEAIVNTIEFDSTLNERGYVTYNSGYYTKEPQFANMIQEARSIGFQLFGYESEGETNMKEREIFQAQNINDFMNKNNQGKYLIHCGFAHAAEGNYGGSWEKAMAQRLKELRGIDPYTINQNSYSETSSRNQEKAYYSLANNTEPTVYLSADNKSIGYYRNDDTYFDCYVFQPKFEEGERPNWLLSNNRKLVKLNIYEVDGEGPFLVKAIRNGESINEAVPADVQESTNKLEEVRMALKQGAYQIIVVDNSGKAYKSSLVVE